MITTDYKEDCALCGDEVAHGGATLIIDDRIYFKCSNCNKEYTTTLIDTINHFRSIQLADQLGVLSKLKSDKRKEDIKAYKICSHCNKEFEMEFYRSGVNPSSDATQCTITMAECPHCNKTNHVWARFVVDMSKS